MRSQACVLGAALVLGALLTASCQLYLQALTPGAARPTQVGTSGAGVATVVPASAVSAASIPVSAQFPICQVTASCAALNAEQIMLDCVKKIPYTNVLVPRGTTFEVVDSSGDFTCIDTGVVVNGKEVLTCHGKQLYSFQLKLSNAACSESPVTGTGQCEAGYGYNAAQQCCAPVSGDSSGAAIVTIDLGACP